MIRTVTRESLVPMVAGLAVETVAAWMLSGLIRSLLFEVAYKEGLSLALSAVVLLGAAVFSGVVSRAPPRCGYAAIQLSAICGSVVTGAAVATGIA